MNFPNLSFLQINRVLILLVTLFFSLVSVAREPVDETKSASALGFVKVSVVRGDLEIKGWDRDEIQVTGELDEQTKNFVFRVDGNEAFIEVKIPDRNRNWCVGYCNEGSDLTIMIPRGSTLKVSVVSTEVKISDVLGGLDIGGVSGDIFAKNARKRVRISSVSGSIELRHAKGRIRLSSVSGDVEATDVHGTGKYHSVSGDIVLNEVSGDMDLESVSGEIEATSALVSVLRGSTVSGDIRLEFEPSSDVDIEFNSISGSIFLDASDKIAANFDLETGSGNIRNRITSDEPRKSKYVRDETLRFSTGDGRVYLSTRSGNITIND